MRPVACPPIQRRVRIKMVGTAQERLCPPYAAGISRNNRNDLLAPMGPIQALRSYRVHAFPFQKATARPMTADTDSDLPPPPAHEPARRSGSIVLVLLVAGAIVAAAVA